MNNLVFGIAGVGPGIGRGRRGRFGRGVGGGHGGGGRRGRTTIAAHNCISD